MFPERIEVAAIFDGKGMQPLAFRWGRSRRKVEAVTYRWESRQGRERVCHFSTISEAGLYHLSFHTNELAWFIEGAQDL